MAQGKYTKYYIIIAIVSAALGIGTGLLIKDRMNAKKAAAEAEKLASEEIPDLEIERAE